METNEAVRRIFWRHRWLLIALVILPVAVVVPFLEHKPVTFSATAHVQGDATTPSAQTQVTAIQSRVTAVATDPTIVGSAIAAAHLHRDALTVARHDVSVTPLGSSAVMLVTVTDPSRAGAIRLAGALATAVLDKLDQLGTQYNPQLAALNAASQQLTTKRDKLVAELNAADLQGQNASNVKVQSLLAQLSGVEQQLSSNLQAAEQILTTVGTGAEVLAAPTFATGTSRHVLEYGALAGLLGLVVGLLIASIREILRPTVAEPAAGARELGAVQLGDAETVGEQVVGDDGDLDARLRIAADRAGAHTIVLAGPVPRPVLASLARRLDHGWSDIAPDGRSARPVASDAGARPLNGDRPVPAGDLGPRALPDGLSRHRGPGQAGVSQRRVVTLADLGDDAPAADPVLVAVLPRFAPHAALDRIADLAATTDWPLLGVIGLRTRRRDRRRATDTTAPDTDSQDTMMMGAIR